MKQKLFFSCCCATLLAPAFLSCGGKQDQAPQGQPQTYQTLTVELCDKTLTERYPASLKGKQDIDIYPQISGTIGKVYIKEGQRVRKGQRLFVIEQGTYYAALNQAVANVKAAEASLTSSQLTYRSKETLFKDSVISNYELQTAYNALAKAKAELAQAKAQEASARTNYNYTIITSPANGVVGTLPYFQGDLVSPSISQPLTTISDNSQIYAYFSITEKQFLALNREFGASERADQKPPEILLQLSDGTAYSHKGHIESISGVVDRSTGSTSIRAVYPNPDGLLHSGFSANVVLPTTYKDCVVIPQSATTEVQDKVFVYKVVDGKAKGTQVQVLPTDDGNEYVVTAGLRQGDVIISTGAGLVKDGAAVVIAKDASSKAMTGTSTSTQSSSAQGATSKGTTAQGASAKGTAAANTSAGASSSTQHKEAKR